MRASRSRSWNLVAPRKAWTAPARTWAAPVRASARPAPGWSGTASAAPAAPDGLRAQVREEDRSAFRLRLAAAFVLLMPFNWILGTSLPVMFATAALIGWPLRRPSGLELGYVFLAAALALAVGIGLLHDLAPNQIVGAAFNVVLILAMAGFVNFGRRLQVLSDDALPAAPIYRAAFWCFWAQMAVVAASAAWIEATGIVEAKFPTLLGIFGELPGILSYYSGFFLSVGDGEWPFTTPRIVGIGIYTTEGAILVLVVGLLASLHALLRGRLVVAAVIEALIAVALVGIASRTTLMAFLVSFAFLPVLAGRGLVRVGIVLVPVIVAAVLLGTVFGPHLVGALVDAVNGSRAESSATRLISYRLGIAMTLQHNPLTGLGILPKDKSIIEIPIGSHSSWTSLFTRGGFAALACWICINGLLLVRLVQSQWRVFASVRRIAAARRLELVFLARCVFVLMAWWVTEDFDFPVNEVGVAGLCLGLFVGALEPRRSGWPLRRHRG